MSLETFRELCKRGASDYYAELPFHNMQHAANVEQRAYDLCLILGLDETTLLGVILGARMHDAGYHLARPEQFPTKEDYSIHLMRERAHTHLKNSGLKNTEVIIQLAESGIHATKLDCSDFTTEPRKILRAADIPNLGSPDPVLFHTNSANIYREIQQLYTTGGTPTPLENFQNSQVPLLTGLLEKTEEGIPEEPYFFHGYYANFRKNIALCLSDDFQKYVANQNPNQ